MSNVASRFVSVAVVLSAWYAAGVRADTVNELFKLNASDAAHDDAFGGSIDTDGDLAIVGSFQDDHVVSAAGSAYIYDPKSGQQLRRLSAHDPARDDLFGYSVGINGDTAIVGASRDDDDGSGSGSAYLFRVTDGQELFKLRANDASSSANFGTAVAIDDSKAIVGAPFDNQSVILSGAVYVFDASTGKQLLKFKASDPALGSGFGSSLAVSGNTAIVGALSQGSSAGVASGAAYLFDITTGEQLHKLTASDAGPEQFFGRSVAISGNMAIVGSGDYRNPSFGAAYVFDVTTGLQLFKLLPSDSADESLFGFSVDIDGNNVVVGVPRDVPNFDNPYGNDLQGFAYVFDATTGRELRKLIGSDSLPGDDFGWHVAIGGNYTLVGSPGDVNSLSQRTGSAYVFLGVPEPTSFVLFGSAMMLLTNRWGSVKRHTGIASRISRPSAAVAYIK